MTAPFQAAGAQRRRWRREPIVHFLAIGALLLAASAILQRLQPPDAIVVDAARVRHLAQLYRLQTGRDPGPAETEVLVRGFIEEEALSREARSLGLDRDDAIVRRRLVQKMTFLEPDVVTTPGDDVLRRFQAANPALFMHPADISFEQLYFSPDTAGPAASRQAADQALAQLDAGASPAAIAADPLPVSVDTAHQAPETLQRAFGNSPIVAALETAPVGRWAGPVASGFGWHLVRVTARLAGRAPDFQSNRAAVLAAWQQAESDRVRRQAREDVVARYKVIRRDAVAAEKR